MRKINKIGFAAAGLALAISSFQLFPAAAQENEFVLETNAPLSGDASMDYLPNVSAITKQVMPSIVAITAASKETIRLWGRTYVQDSESAGSGVIIAKTEDELIIATNNHVVDNADDLTVLFSVDVEDSDTALVPALVKGTDSSIDLAVVSVKLDDIPKEVLDQISVVEIGDSSAVNVGDWSIAIGNALGYGQSVTFGIVSALDREVKLTTEHGEIANNMIQTDAAINFGNSGGALLNGDGQLIGINSAKASSTGVEGMGYAIPINAAKPILEDLMNQTTRVKADADKAGVMGINITDVSSEARQLYNIPAGAYVTSVNENSAAQDAGMLQGDIIVKLDRTSVTSVNELLSRMEYYEAGEDIDVTVKRQEDGRYEEKVLTVTLQAKDKDKQKDTDSDSHSKKKKGDQKDSEDDYYEDEFYEDYDDDSYGYEDGYYNDEDFLSDITRYGFGFGF